MRIVRNLDELPADMRSGAVAIGNFDGVHRGHARIALRLLAMAERVHGPAVVFTFDPHPVRLLRPEHAPPPLTWTDRKLELLEELGIEATVVYPTDEALLALSARQFFDTVVRDRLNARGLVEGPNFSFGRGREGTIDLLGQMTREAGIELEVVEPLMVQGDYISSSRVRSLISAGEVDQARQLLTQPYRIRGMVTHGAGRGAKIGFPTANVDAIDTLIPGPGVYAGIARVEGAAWPAAMNVGPNPTFGEMALKVEVHLIGFRGLLYGAPLEVDFLSRLRNIQPFDGVAALQAQLRADVAAAQQIAEQTLHPRGAGGQP